MAICPVCRKDYNCPDAYLYNACPDCIKWFEQDASKDAKEYGFDPDHFGFNEWSYCTQVKLSEMREEISHKVAMDRIEEYKKVLEYNRAQAEAWRRLRTQDADANKAAIDKLKNRRS